MRTDRGLSLTTVSNATGTSINALSRLERGIAHDTHLARATHQWLTNTEP